MTTETSSLLRIKLLLSLNTKIGPKIPVELEFFTIRPPPQPRQSPPVTGAAAVVVSIRWRFRGSRGFEFLIVGFKRLICLR